MKFHQGTQQWEISFRAVENLSLSRICQCIAKQTVWLASKSAKKKAASHLKGVHSRFSVYSLLKKLFLCSFKAFEPLSDKIPKGIPK